LASDASGSTFAGLGLALALVVSTLVGIAPATMSVEEACEDVHEEATMTATGLPDETVLGSSLESGSVTFDIGSPDCRIVQLDAELTAPDGELDGNSTADAELVVDFEGITLAESREPGTSESLSLDAPPWGSYEFSVEPWSAIQTPVTLTVDAVLTEDSEPSGPNADQETVVVGVVDTGINPYHDEFSADTYPGSLALDEHPSNYIEEYPEPTPSLDLTLDAPYDEARDEDDWDQVEAGQLYWLPGTKIVGAYHAGGDIAGGDEVTDENGHGTASAAVAAGNTVGSCERCLIVSVEGEAGLSWALAQPWIDIVSNSWGTIGNAGVPTAGNNDLDPLGAGGEAAQNTRAAVERGQTVLAAAGNGMANFFLVPQPTYTNPLAGPDWTVTVGATSVFEDCDCSGDEGFITASGKPVDVSSYATGDIPAADHESTNESAQHGGTSAATPNVAGVMGETLLEARETLGDEVGGTRDAAIAEGPAITGPHVGMLDDGELTRAELEEAVRYTAQHSSSEWISAYPVVAPTFPVPEDLAWAQWGAEGWGVVAERTGANATDVVVGDQPMPEGSFDEQQAALDEQVRAQLWGGAVEP